MQTIVGLAKIQNKCQNRIPGANTSLLLFCRLCFHLLQMLGLGTNWCLCWRWTQGESHTASQEDRPSPPGGGPPLPGVTRTATVGKAPKSPLAACVWSIQGGIWSVSSAPFMGSKWIQKAKKKKKSSMKPVSFYALDSKLLLLLWALAGFHMRTSLPACWAYAEASREASVSLCLL